MEGLKEVISIFQEMLVEHERVMEAKLASITARQDLLQAKLDLMDAQVDELRLGGNADLELPEVDPDDVDWLERQIHAFYDDESPS